MDVGAEFIIPNPFALRPDDFGHDMDGYRAALGFLSDLAGGSDHDHALTNNGGSKALLTGWKASTKFRRVYEKCRAANLAERETAAASESESDGESATQPQGQRFIPLEEMPARRGLFSAAPNRASWGGG